MMVLPCSRLRRRNHGGIEDEDEDEDEEQEQEQEQEGLENDDEDEILAPTAFNHTRYSRGQKGLPLTFFAARCPLGPPRRG